MRSPIAIEISTNLFLLVKFEKILATMVTGNVIITIAKRKPTNRRNSILSKKRYEKPGK
ncbi:hypothetical protein ccbrp13_60320 [Ktedonobacteria bacterium brp13]|nr:hypothetical protein ccbrp13_60320 [Ktedonobacteria bacterium brp13]